MTSRTVLILSPYFPPSTLAGVHRARLLAKHLPRHGWEPVVLCVDEIFHEQRLDPELAELVPTECEIIKVPALPIGLTRPFGLGEISLRARWSLRRKLFELLKTRKIDTVLITGSPFYSMLLGPEIKLRFDVPIVLDFQDPWVSAWGAQQPLGSKIGLSHRLATWLEPKAVRAADFITSVSDKQNAEMIARYTWLNPSRMMAIPIGGDPEDFDCLRNSHVGSIRAHLDPRRINLSYVGTFMPRTGEPMRALFRGVRRLQAEAPETAAKLRLNFVGTSNQPNESTVYRVRPLADQEGVAEAIYEVPQRLPYLEALSVLANSSAILLIGSDEPHYTASKIYPALMSGTPFISLFHSHSSAHKILSAAGGGIALSFDGSDQLSSLVPALADALKRIAINGSGLGRANPAAYEEYEASAVALAYSGIFNRLTTGS